MKEYIEREALLKKNMYGNANPITHRTYAKNLIKSAPAADVVEVRHAYWKYNHNGTFVCSDCGGKASKMNWCGHCGAKMDAN